MRVIFHQIHHHIHRRIYQHETHHNDGNSASQSQRPAHQTGYGLIEVLISLIVIAIGLLGTAKMQALGIANTKIAGQCGLIALQAGNLAAILHSNRGYWQVTSSEKEPASPRCPSPAGCTLSGSDTVTDPGHILIYPPTAACTHTAPCPPGRIAALDIANWMKNMHSHVPGYTATINCTNTTSTPTTCIISVRWPEKITGMNTTTATMAATQAMQIHSYFLHVQP